MATDEDRRQTAIKGRLPDGHEKYQYDGDINSQTISSADFPQESIEGAASQNRKSLADVMAMIIAGEISLGDLEDLQRLLQPNLPRMDHVEDNENGDDANQPVASAFTDIYRDTPSDG